MSGQVSRGSAGDYQADERAGVAWLISHKLYLILAATLSGNLFHPHFRAKELEAQGIEVICTSSPTSPITDVKKKSWPASKIMLSL